MKALLKWHGRVARAEFFSYSFGLNILSGVLALLFNNLPGSLLSSLFNIAVSIFFGYLGICLVIRRLHDLNKPGWYYLAFAGAMLSLAFIGQALFHVAIYIAIPLFLFCAIAIYFVKGTDGDNQYGPDPLALTAPMTSE